MEPTIETNLNRDLATLRRLTEEIAQTNYISGKPYLVIPQHLTVVDMEEHLPQPLAIKRNIVFHDPDSFFAYVNEFKTEKSRAFCMPDIGEVVVAIDATTKDSPSWEKHIAKLEVCHSPKWKRWANANETWTNQWGFSEFLEDNHEDIIEPAGAELFEMAKNLQVKKSINIVGGVTLQSGDKEIVYTEESEGKQMKMVVPETITIVVPVFKGDANYRIQLKLRYRANEQGIQFKLSMRKVDEIIDDAVDELIKQTSEKIDMPVLKIGSF